MTEEAPKRKTELTPEDIKRLSIFEVQRLMKEMQNNGSWVAPETKNLRYNEWVFTEPYQRLQARLNELRNQK